MSFTILGLGIAQPAHSLTQERAAELTSRWSGHSEDQALRLAALYRRAGIRRRHVVLSDPAAFFEGSDEARGPSTASRMRRYDAEVRPLALVAAGRALSASGLASDAITHLVTVSCTGFAAPGFDLALLTGLGLSTTVQRTHVGFMGCHGALNGLRVAGAFTAGDPSARVLLCAAELCSLHFSRGWDPERAVANALFADGAAAIVGAPELPERPAAWRLAAGGSFLVPDSESCMAWHVGDHGFEMGLSPRVAGLIGQHLRPWLEGWLARSDLGLGEVASWAVHPGGPRILESVRDALGLGDDAMADSREVLAACGNMSSPTVLFILDRLRRRSAPLPCVALAFGPGLVIEAALLT